MQADSAGVVGHLDWILPPGGDWHLTCQIRREGHILAINEYDLAIHDGIQPTLGQRVQAWLSGLVTPS